MQQLELFRIVKQRRQLPEAVVSCIEEMKAQEAEGMAIARELFPDHQYSQTRDMPTPMFRQVWQEYHRRNPRPQPINLPDTTPDIPDRKPPKPKRYQEWTLERKQRERVRKLHERARKRFSIFSLYAEYLQAEAVKNPQYFGVCPLPGAVASSKLNLQDLLPNPAKEYEKALREQEILEYEIKYEGKQALSIPLALKNKEYEHLHK